jgi:hypothetical protein
MANNLQLSVSVRNARLDAIETTISTSPILKIRTGTQPATCATASTGTVLATMTLPSDWLAAAASGAKALAGTWQDASADNSGTAAHFEILDSGGTVCHMRGTVGTTGCDLNLDSTSITAGQSVTITSFTLTDANP